MKTCIALTGEKGLIVRLQGVIADSSIPTRVSIEICCSPAGESCKISNFTTLVDFASRQKVRNWERRGRLMLRTIHYHG